MNIDEDSENDDKSGRRRYEKRFYSSHQQKEWSGWSSFSRNSSSNVVVRRNLRLRSNLLNNTSSYSCEFDTLRGGCKNQNKTETTTERLYDIIRIGSTTESSTLATTSILETTTATTPISYKQASLMSFRQNKDQIKEEIRKLQEENQRIAKGLPKKKNEEETDVLDNENEMVSNSNSEKTETTTLPVKKKKIKKLKRQKKYPQYWDGPQPDCAWDGPKGCLQNTRDLAKPTTETTKEEDVIKHNNNNNVIIEKSRFSNILNKRLERKSQVFDDSDDGQMQEKKNDKTKLLPGKTVKEKIKEHLRQKEIEKKKQFQSLLAQINTAPVQSDLINDETFEDAGVGELALASKQHKRHKRKLNFNRESRIYSVEEWLRMG